MLPIFNPLKSKTRASVPRNHVSMRAMFAYLSDLNLRYPRELAKGAFLASWPVTDVPVRLNSCVKYYVFVGKYALK